MQASAAGALVTLALLALGFALRSPLIVPLIGSLAFGSTAILTLSAVGGSSPLIYVVFALLVALLAVQRGARRDVICVFREIASAWIIALLAAYAVLGAIVLPRLFAGQTTAFVASRDDGRVAEVLLGPTSGNITQSAYLTLGALVFLTLSVRLLRRPALEAVRRGFILWATLNAALGAAELAGKLVGAGDVLLPIRSASYALLTDVEQAGFSRLVGGHSESSAFGGAAVACLAFSFSQWRATGARGLLVLWLVLAALVVLSTSSTAYVGLAAVVAGFALSALWSAATGRPRWRDLVVALLAACGLAAVLGVAIRDERRLEPFTRLFNETLIEKQSSDSAQERGYWNERSLQTVLDTSGLGVGIGSSRASNWPIAVASQLGALGIVLMGALVAVLLGGPGARAGPGTDRNLLALHGSVRAAIFAGLACSLVGGGSADPGLLFFIGCATLIACRRHLRARAPRGSAALARHRRPLPPLAPRRLEHQPT